MKQCNKCGKELGRSNKSGLCQRCYHNAYYIAHKEAFIKKARQWAKNNIERYRAYRRQNSKKKWAALSAKEKTDKSRQQEKGRSLKSLERKRAYLKKYYQKNKNTKWKNHISFKEPCIVCGKEDPKTRYIDRKCRSCYGKEKYKETHKREEKFCAKCGKGLRKFTKLEKCRSCRNKERYWSDPEYRKKICTQNTINNKKEVAREKKRLALIRRRAKAKKLESSLTFEEWNEIVERFDHRCAYCGEKKKIEKDHIIPVSKGGPTTKENIVPCCRTCNSKKNNSVGVYFPMNPETIRETLSRVP